MTRMTAGAVAAAAVAGDRHRDLGAQPGQARHRGRPRVQSGGMIEPLTLENLIRRTIIGAALGALVIAMAATPGFAATGKPDGRAKVEGETFVGQGVFTPPAPIEDQTVEVVGDSTFIIKVKNRGTQTDTIKVKTTGTTAFSEWDLFYKGKDVQDAAGTGDLKLRNIAPGDSSKPLQLVADLQDGTPGAGAQVTLRFKSGNQSTRTDSVRVVAIG